MPVQATVPDARIELSRLNNAILKREAQLADLDRELEIREERIRERRREIALMNSRVTATRRRGANKDKLPAKLCFRLWTEVRNTKDLNVVLKAVRDCLVEAVEMEPSYEAVPKLENCSPEAHYLLVNVELPKGLRDLFLNLLTERRIGRIEV